MPCVNVPCRTLYNVVDEQGLGTIRRALPGSPDAEMMKHYEADTRLAFEVACLRAAAAARANDRPAAEAELARATELARNPGGAAQPTDELLDATAAWVARMR
jgi:hypothetical protein